MAAGAGMYQIALVGVAFAVLIITVLWLVMRFLPPVESSTQKNASAGHEE